MKRLAGRIILLWGWRRHLVAFLAGAVASLGLAPIDFPAGGFIAFPLLVWLLDGAVEGGLLGRVLPFIAVGWWFGFGYFLAGTWWVSTALLTGNAEHTWAFPFLLLGLPAGLALFYGLAALLARALWSEGIGRVAALAFGFGAAEWLRATALSGLSWNAIGYSAMPVPLLMQAVDLVGVFGMSATVVFVFSSPALLGTGIHARAGLTTAAVLLLGQIGYGYVSLSAPPPPGPTIQVRVVQPYPKQDAPVSETFDNYLALSGSPSSGGEPQPQLILWPELAIPSVLAEKPEQLNMLVQAVGEDQVLVFGTQRREAAESTQRLYNSAVAITKEGIANASDQVSSLPFARQFARLPGGEETTSPFPDGRYSAGSSRRLFQVADAVEALPLIGIEAAIPSVAAQTEGADLLLNLANYSAFVGTTGSLQHLRQVQVLAAEAGLPVVVALPNGFSSIIDSRGRILESLSSRISGIVDFSLHLSNMKASKAGNNPMSGLAMVAIFGILALVLSIGVRMN